MRRHTRRNRCQSSATRRMSRPSVGPSNPVSPWWWLRWVWLAMAWSWPRTWPHVGLSDHPPPPTCSSWPWPTFCWP
ncbi:unnamed protein product [Gulo gulo]|uniref:Uncharacterized protein n=1 Tax=Gulo gulo TaxID=48420 RepID=A0A9X9LGJ8_GULGU|nr:unnamed protein product [Gulo gulo]